jgi:hypothetical protein|tara:strand:+ start:257 stop:403 length:147 start_codon:yes stop_codon:yes gene_type:complete
MKIMIIEAIGLITALLILRVIISKDDNKIEENLKNFNLNKKNGNRTNK